MAIEFTESAAKHGFTRDDAIHAVQNHSHYQPEFDRSRTDGRKPHLAIGPSLTGEDIEVMFTVGPGQNVRIFHCMLAREKMKRYFDRKGQ